jgi:hypothetical protein
MRADEMTDIWRYATRIGERDKQNLFYSRGWVLQR